MKRVDAPLISLALVLLLTFISFSALAVNDTFPQEEEGETSMGMGRETQFIRNMGQWDSDLEYAGITSFGSIGLGTNEIFFDVHVDDSTGQIVKYNFVDSNDPKMETSDQMGHDSNFFVGNDPSRWVSSVPSFNTINYDQLWDGIDLTYRSKDLNLKYEFTLDPFADPDSILVEVDGANDLLIEEKEINILLENEVTLEDSGLVVNYGDGEKETIEASFKRVDDNIFGFNLGNYDNSRPIVIDPFIEATTFIGTSSDDRGGGFQRDDNGNFYCTGTTTSMNFPVTTGVYDTTNNGWGDLVIFKFDSTLSTLVYSTYFGGGRDDYGSMALDSNGSVFIAGNTFSNDIPTTSGAYDTTYQPSGTIFGESDGWVARLDDNCTELGFGTYLGVQKNESLWHVYVDSSDNPIVVGHCESGSFPTTTGAYDTTHNGNYDLYVTKLNYSGDKILYSTFIGGSNTENPNGIAHPTDDVLYITGLTRSNNFPTTSGAYQTTFAGGSQGFNSFVLKLNISSSTLEMSTFMGICYGNDIKLDDTGNIHIVGMTISNSFPTTTGAYDTSRNGQEDGVYFKLNPSGSQLLYSTFIGGSQWDSLTGLDINSTGSVFCTGRSRSSNYPTTGGCQDDTYNSGWDIVVSRFNPQGTRLVYSTYLGGSSDESPSKIMLVDEDRAYIGGITKWAGFPTPTTTYDTTHNGGYDIFISRVNLSLVLLAPEKPRNLTGAMTDDEVNLQWRIPINDGGSEILHYSIFRGTTPTSLTNIANTTSLDHKDTGLDLRKKYYYTVTATNSIGNSLRHPVISFWERDPPVFNEDLTPINIPAGTEVTIIANITDNVEVGTVNVEYWIGGSIHQNQSMVNATGEVIWSHSIIVPDIVTELTYKFSAVDIKGNKIGTQMFSRDITGEVYPVLWNDHTPNIAAPSTQFDFYIDVRDNHKVDQVKVEFWVDGGTHSENFMYEVEGTDTYTYTTTIPNVVDKNLHYIFKARDNDQKWNETLEKSVPILDTLSPEFLADSSGTEGEAGFPFSFMVSVKDNLHVSSVSVEYWFDGGNSNTEAMKRGSGNKWSSSVNVPETVTSLSYRFRAMDPTGNMNSTPAKMVNITDPISPVFINDSSDMTALVGIPFNFRVKGYDNMGSLQIGIEYWFNEDDRDAISLKESGDFMIGSLDIPVEMTGTLNYLIIITDASGNFFQSEITEIEILDNIAPTIQAIEDLTIYLGENIAIFANTSDNIGVKSISWLSGPFQSSTLEFQGTPGEAGVYDISVVVKDPSDNSAVTSFHLTVLPQDQDTDMDGIPDLIEIDLGLDKNDNSDGFGDFDDDGLPNWLEFTLDLMVDDPDTDNDGMPDGWEYENGLVPNIISSSFDFDKDGFTDLQEYQAGTDPRVSDEVITTTEDFDATFLIIILIILILLMLGIWGFVGFRMMKKDKQELPPLPVGEQKVDELDQMLDELPAEEPVQEPQYYSGSLDPPLQDEAPVTEPVLQEQAPVAEPEPQLPNEQEIPPDLGEQLPEQMPPQQEELVQ